MAKARRTPAAGRSATSGRAPRRKAAPRSTRGAGLSVGPQTVRSLIGVVLLVLGGVTVIALLLPDDGLLSRFVEGFLRPAFGQGAWLFAVLLIVAGAFVERAPRVGNGWGVIVIGGLLVFLGGEGLIHLLRGGGEAPADLRQGGGAVGQALSSTLSELVSPAGAAVVLIGVLVGGILLMFDLTLRALVRPVAVGGRAIYTAMPAPSRWSPRIRGDRGVETVPVSAGEPVRQRSGMPAAARPGRRGHGEAAAGESGAGAAALAEELPSPISSPAPMSQTVWSATGLGSTATASGSPAATAGQARTAGTAGADPAAVLEDAPTPLHDRPWSLPAVASLDAVAPKVGGARLDHDRNIRIIEEKLRSFQIPAQVVSVNTGPVVTQYEVKPDVRVKLSRIEGLADDLAMALAARSIRIEAPIPGRDVVGIEIPNHSAEIVSFKSLYEDSGMANATGKLTFALGRDVSGKAYAVDLAKMPHLLIAGATGSGKSVCVNALITSILMRARPDEVQFVLIDLKRVELAPYDALPHLKTSVIVEATHARAALNWAVHQMEDRYKQLAARGERNITAFNASTRVARAERLPYIVVVIDELADLIMREGRKVEDPVVKIAQKARAVGIHLVLATQRPSVNVVTGLIKANVPSRIAFAMSSNVDSRTVLDQPGAEDLIGRGDMLYQPADLPRPVRLQGVYVSDEEVRAVTEHWREQAPEPMYDPELLAAAEDEDSGGGQFAWLAKMAEDELTARAAELVMQTGKASTSMMQTKLKVGFNRASRLMDELERFGIVGPQDPRNPAVPRQVYGPDNWIRGAEDIDDL
ncbi:MAG: DNA translocase FtsK 4TM domain-containing protein [Chloroflexi bacterium]|nr:DNA translocase FtsK 4TM domain-containing protein [Chloroflexota bacterium]